MTYIFILKQTLYLSCKEYLSSHCHSYELPTMNQLNASSMFIKEFRNRFESNFKIWQSYPPLFHAYSSKSAKVVLLRNSHNTLIVQQNMEIRRHHLSITLPIGQNFLKRDESGRVKVSRGETKRNGKKEAEKEREGEARPHRAEG